MAHGHHPIATGKMSRIHLLTAATAGACAAITSEAFMNPFDGVHFLDSS